MTFINKIIKSRYLDKDFTVSCWDLKQGGRTLTIVEHAALENIIFNALDVKGFSFDLEPIIGIAEHPVMKCVMQDATGRKIIAFGEAHAESLVNNISRQNPVIMAGNRAFDRAAIRYLDLEGKVYSSEEISDEDNSSTENITGNSASDVVLEDSVVSEDAIVDETISDSFETKEAQDVIIETATDAYDKDSDPNVGAMLVSFGKYRGQPKTVADIWKEDEEWAEKIIIMEMPTCGEMTKKQISALKRYKEGV